MMAAAIARERFIGAEQEAREGDERAAGVEGRQPAALVRRTGGQAVAISSAARPAVMSNPNLAQP
jgi:hypothetical protein